jgi:transposase-like protein
MPPYSVLCGASGLGLHGARLAVRGDHEGIKLAVFSELSGVDWQRCVVHSECNVLSHVSTASMAEVAQDLKANFELRRQKTVRALVKELVELYRKCFPKAVSVLGSHRGGTPL